MLAFSFAVRRLKRAVDEAVLNWENSAYGTFHSEKITHMKAFTPRPHCRVARMQQSRPELFLPIYERAMVLCYSL